MSTVAPAVECLWCSAPVRKASVLVGRRLPGHLVWLWIDVEAHPDGEVIERGDGQLRMLRNQRRLDPNRAAFRVHSARSCGAGGQP